MANYLLMSKVSTKQLIEMGFVKDDDEYPDFHIVNDKFHLMVDILFDVKLARRNPDTDFIDVVCNNEFDLRNLIDFIQD